MAVSNFCVPLWHNLRSHAYNKDTTKDTTKEAQRCAFFCFILRFLRFFCDKKHEKIKKNKKNAKKFAHIKKKYYLCTEFEKQPNK